MFIDISWPITPDMTSYKDAKPVAVTAHKQVAQDGVTDSSITMNLHTGTHIDAPIHFVPGGKTVDQLPLTALNGPCRILDLAHASDAITGAHLQPYAIQRGERILLKTRNSARSITARFDYDFVYLAESGAQHLAECGVVLVGIDALGVERAQPDHATHRVLFENDVMILEGLRLAQVKKETATLYALPLKIVGVEAAPVRAVLYP